MREEFVKALLWLCIVVGMLMSSYESILSSRFRLAVGENNARKLNSMIKIRAGDPGQRFVWYYSGVIRNPLTGGELIGIEGLELTRAIDNNHNHVISPFNSTSHLITKLKQFLYLSPSSSYSTTPSPSCSPNPSNDISFQKSFLSRKVFMFTANKNRSQIITSYRIRPHSPLRTIHSPIKVIHELITFGTYKNDNIFAYVEHPGGRRVVSGNMALTGDTPVLSFFPWTRLRYDLTCFLYARKRKHINKYISFAPATDKSGRSQEYYTYTHDTVLSSPKLQCRRFGECPAWFAPGRSCSTELHATRYNSLKDVPKERLQLFRRECPDFFVIPLSLKTFQDGTDLLDRYPPWYVKMIRIFRKQKKSQNSQLGMNTAFE